MGSNPRCAFIFALALAALAVGVGLPSFAWASGDPDADAARVQALRVEYAGKREALARTLASELAGIVADGLAQTQQMQARAKISGNITAQAAASTAMRIYTEAGEELKRSGQLRFPDNIRPDLQNLVVASRNAKTASIERHAVALRALDAEYAPRLLARTGEPADAGAALTEQQQAMLSKLAETKPSPAATNATPAVQADAVMIRASGEAAQWDAILRGEIHVTALEIVSFSIAGIVAPRQNRNVGGLTGGPFSIDLTPFREFVPVTPAPAFRVMSLPPLTPVDVARWPTADNGWTMELRARPRGSSRHGFVLEVDAAANATRPLPGQGAVAPPSPPAPVVAPGHAPTTHTTAPSRPTPVAPPSPTPSPSPPAALSQTIPVSASAQAHVRTGIQLRRGSRVYVTASGNWSCGPGGEMVDAHGYPNNERFFRYYMNPRQNPRISPTANYGALIGRILPDGVIHALGQEMSFEADRHGELTLDINEDVSARRDNRGTLTVHIVVK